MTDLKQHHVSVFHKGLPVHLVTLNDFSEELACKRAKNAVWMAALKDGREFMLTDMHAEIYHGEVTA